VILEAVPNEKSGVLVTGDTETGTRDKMMVATSEGVGGAVDGTPAETLLWSPKGVELVTTFKSPWRRMLQASGSSAIVASTGSDHVLEPRELTEIVGAGRVLNDTLEPARDPTGAPRPWDVEFGFVKGKLWLFQCRPFVGNDELKNVTALGALEGPIDKGNAMVSLEEALK
jgi:pyruvate phosphate dikinase-like enzyme